MKKTANKITLNILIALITILCGYFIYKSFLAYKGYQVIQKSEKYIQFANDLNLILQQIEQEHSSSAIYLGYNGKIDFNNLENLREKTDNTIEKTTLFIQNNPTFSPYLQNLTKLSENLQYVRSRVDVLSSDYKSILFDYYQNDISHSLIQEIKNITQKLSFQLDNLKEYLNTYINLIEFRNRADKEKSFISFILSQSKKMSKEDLILWNTILKNEITPSFDNLDNRTTKKIRMIMHPSNFSKLSFNLRAEVAKGVTTGNYSIDTNQWIKKMDEKIEKIKLSEQIIYKYLKADATNIVLSPKEIMVNIGILLFLLFLLILLLIYSNKKRENEKNFRDKKDKQKELSKIINQNREIRSNIFGTDMPLTDARAPQSSKKVDLIEDESKTELNVFNIFEEFKYIKFFEEKASKKSIEYNYYIDSTLYSTCIGDSTKIKLVLANLINHAIDFSPTYSSIHVRIDKIAEMKTEYAIKFSVLDSGSYINKEQKHKIKKAFYQKSYTHTEPPATMETDLTIAGKLISLMGGVMEIDSTQKKGTNFSFTLALKKHSDN